MESMSINFQDRLFCCNRNDTFVPLLTNHLLSIENSNITSVIIAIHGLNENVAGSFKDVSNGADNRTDSTLIVVPWFHTGNAPYIWGDMTNPNVSSMVGIRWMANASWISSGDPYVAFGSSQELPLSSYGVLDSLYEYFTQPTKYPNLQQISYVGFSAGGQMINRYAWASKIGRPLHRIAPNTKGTTETTPGESADISATNVRVRFIVSDASSYLYFDNLRPAGECRASYDTGVSHTCDTFTRYYNSNELPLIHLRGEGFDRTMEEEEEEGVAEVTTCKEFNNWKFGTNIIPGVELGYSYFQPFIDQPDLIKEHTYWYRQKNIKYVFGSWDSCNCKAVDFANADHCAPKRADGSYAICAPVLVAINTSQSSNSAPTCCDTFPDATNNDLATSCGSNLQGSNRLQRGLNYMAYLKKYYTSRDYARMAGRFSEASRSGQSETLEGVKEEFRPIFAVVPELMHDSPAFYTSGVVQDWLYTLQSKNSTNGATAPSVTTAAELPSVPGSAVPLLFDVSNVAFIALYVGLCLCIGAALGLVLRYRAQQPRRQLRALNNQNNHPAGEPTEETYLLL